MENVTAPAVTTLRATWWRIFWGVRWVLSPLTELRILDQVCGRGCVGCFRLPVLLDYLFTPSRVWFCEMLVSRLFDGAYALFPRHLTDMLFWTIKVGHSCVGTFHKAS